MLGSCIGRLQKVVDFSPAEKWVAAVQRVGRAQSSGSRSVSDSDAIGRRGSQQAACALLGPRSPYKPVLSLCRSQMVVDTWSGTMALVNSGNEAQGTASVRARATARARADQEQSSSRPSPPPKTRVSWQVCRPVSWSAKLEERREEETAFTSMSHTAGDLWMTRARQHGHPSDNLQNRR